MPWASPRTSSPAARERRLTALARASSSSARTRHAKVAEGHGRREGRPASFGVQAWSLVRGEMGRRRRWAGLLETAGLPNFNSFGVQAWSLVRGEMGRRRRWAGLLETAGLPNFKRVVAGDWARAPELDRTAQPRLSLDIDKASILLLLLLLKPVDAEWGGCNGRLARRIGIGVLGSSRAEEGGRWGLAVLLARRRSVWLPTPKTGVEGCVLRGRSCHGLALRAQPEMTTIKNRTQSTHPDHLI